MFILVYMEIELGKTNLASKAMENFLSKSLQDQYYPALYHILVNLELSLESELLNSLLQISQNIQEFLQQWFSNFRVKFDSVPWGRVQESVLLAIPLVNYFAGDLQICTLIISLEAKGLIKKKSPLDSEKLPGLCK